MSRLNCFTFYENKPLGHEDQLTRAFLVVLRLVPFAQASFIDLIREIQLRKSSKHVIPSLSTAGTQVAEIQTQVTHIENTDGILISVVISDDRWKKELKVEVSDRGARYDGVISYDPEYIIIIENKPRVEHIWEDELKPSLDKDSNIEVDPVLVDLSWRTVIESIGSLLERNLISGTEAIIVSDFLDYVDQHFPYLNPYTSFSICKDHEYLLKRRCQSVMESVKMGTVEYHRGWKYHIKRTGIVKQIALYPRMKDAGDWEIVLLMYPGDTTSQAREFFQSVNKDEFLALQAKGWKISPNMHFSFMSTNMHHATPQMSVEEYVDYWYANQKEIRRVSRDASNFTNLFQNLLQDRVISANDVPELQKHFTNTKRNTINVCPGLEVYYVWSKTKASELDAQGRFEEEVKARIIEGLSTFEKVSPLDKIQG